MSARAPLTAGCVPHTPSRGPSSCGCLQSGARIARLFPSAPRSLWPAVRPLLACRGCGYCGKKCCSLAGSTARNEVWCGQWGKGNQLGVWASVWGCGRDMLGGSSGFGVMRVGYVWCGSVRKSRCSTLQGDVRCCLSPRLELEVAGCIRNLELMAYSSHCESAPLAAISVSAVIQ